MLDRSNVYERHIHMIVSKCETALLYNIWSRGLESCDPMRVKLEVSLHLVKMHYTYWLEYITLHEISLHI